MNDLEIYMIKENMTVYQAIQVLNQNGRKIAFLCCDGILKGTLTDGDLRRFILQHGDMSHNVSEVINYNPIYAREDEIMDYQAYMKKNIILALPIVDRDMRLKRIECIYTYTEDKEYIKLDIPVIIMAGGKGTRLKPYTDILPKPLIPLGDKTIIEHIINNFEMNGCSEFKIIINYKKELIKAYFNETHNDAANIEFIEESDYYGTGGGLCLLRENINSTFFVTNCDILIEDNYAKILEQHKRNKYIITMVCAKKKVVLPYGTAYISDKNEIKKFEEKPEKILNVNTGMYIIEPEFLEFIPNRHFIHITDIIQKCINEKKKVGAYLIEEDAWLDMGQLEEYNKMKIKLGLA